MQLHHFDGLILVLQSSLEDQLRTLLAWPGNLHRLCETSDLSPQVLLMI